MKRCAVLLVNLGTPDKPEKKAVRAYLREFLMDKQVINLPYPLRFILVNLIIIPKRLNKVTGLYKSIWEEDSPIRSILFQQASALELRLQKQRDKFWVGAAMTYGSPSIHQALKSLMEKDIDHLIVLPLYPQFSYTTTTPVIKRVSRALKHLSFKGRLQIVEHYFQHPLYIEALAQQFLTRWKTNIKPEALVLSYHGIPLSYAEKGDPYLEQCKQTTKLIKSALQSAQVNIFESFQSRVTSEEWAKPYTDELLLALAEQKIAHLEISCPGFSADCLETLDEIAIEYQKSYLEAGGESFYCYPALNDSNNHIRLFEALILEQLS